MTTRTIDRARGFTLIEMAVVVFVMALILGSILVPLSSQIEQRQVSEAQRQLEVIREALIGYAMAQARPVLPCPDTTVATAFGPANDGREDIDLGTGNCARWEGNLPWVTLGVPVADPWGNRYRYRVDVNYGQRTPLATFSLTTDSNLFICEAVDPLIPTPPPGCIGTSITEAPPSRNAPAAVVLSHGRNGWGAINATTNAPVLPDGCPAVLGCGAISPNERVNSIDDTAMFVSRPASPPGSGIGEFDDIVIWLSPHTLKYRMVAAGKLP